MKPSVINNPKNIHIFLLEAETELSVPTTMVLIRSRTNSQRNIKISPKKSFFTLNNSKAITAEYMPQTIGNMLNNQIGYELQYC